jgi:hypothetical protein
MAVVSPLFLNRLSKATAITPFCGLSFCCRAPVDAVRDRDHRCVSDRSDVTWALWAISCGRRSRHGDPIIISRFGAASDPEVQQLIQNSIAAEDT